MGNSLKAAFFDWDSTLGMIKGGETKGEVFATLFSLSGYHFDSDSIVAAIDLRERSIRRGYLHGEIKPRTRAQYTIYYQQLLDALGKVNISQKQAEKYYEDYSRLPFILYEDTIPTLQTLADLGMSLGIITNHSSAVRSVIESHVGEFIRPEHIVISDEIGSYKPGAAIFIEAAARLKVHRNKCLYVGDDLEGDAIGAIVQGGYRCAFWLDRLNTGTSKDIITANVYRIKTLPTVLMILRNNYL